jgi:hypothetical protein
MIVTLQKEEEAEKKTVNHSCRLSKRIFYSIVKIACIQVLSRNTLVYGMGPRK